MASIQTRSARRKAMMDMVETELSDAEYTLHFHLDLLTAVLEVPEYFVSKFVEAKKEKGIQELCFDWYFDELRWYPIQFRTEGVYQAMAFVSRLEGIETIYQDVHDEGIEESFEFFKSPLYAQIQNLTLRCDIEERNYMNELCAAIQQHPNIQGVKTEWGEYDDHDYNPILSSLVTLPNIKKVDLDFMGSWNCDLLRQLVSHPPLQEFRLSKSYHDPRHLSASQLRSIQLGLEQRPRPLLKLGLDSFESESMEQYIKTTMETGNVESVDLSTFKLNFNDAFWARLKDSLANNQFCPTDVNLARCHCPNTVLEGIVLNTTLLKVSLGLQAWDVTAGQLVSQVISNHPTLEVFKLWCRTISCSNWYSCLSSLRNSKLQEVGIHGGTDLEKDELLKIAEYACEAKSLKRLYLDGVKSSRDYFDCLPKFDQAGIECIGLGTHPSLTEAELGDEFLSIAKLNYNIFSYREMFVVLLNKPNIKAQLDTIFELNKSGRGYLRDEPNNRKRGVDVLARVSDNIDALYLHLLENPILCNIHDGDQRRHSMKAKKKLSRPVEITKKRKAKRSKTGATKRNK